jgi:hypothetical protein
MSNDVVVTVELEPDVYAGLVTAANEVGVTVSDFAGAIIDNYVRENYAQV